MAEVETTEMQTPELTKAEQKKKDAELTPAELLAFGILPPEPSAPELGKNHQTLVLDKIAATSDEEDDGGPKG